MHHAECNNNQHPPMSLTMIPNDVIIQIVSDYLSTSDWIQFSYTCKQINDLKYLPQATKEKERTAKLTADELQKCLKLASGTLFNVTFNEWNLVRDRTISYLKGSIVKLKILNGKFLTSKSFKYLRGTIKELEIVFCDKLENNDFKYLEKIESLRLEECKGINDKAFHYLKSVVSLSLIRFSTGAITDNAINCLDGTRLHSLIIINCKNFTDQAFINLKALHTLDITKCQAITDEAFVNLTQLHTLRMAYCNQKFITDKAFSYLNKLTNLDMSNCNQLTITNQAFSYLKNLKHLKMDYCKQRTITDSAFEYLAESIESLSVYGVYSLTKKALWILRKSPLKHLSINSHAPISSGTKFLSNSVQIYCRQYES
jgi:hypothetical protein